VAYGVLLRECLLGDQLTQYRWACICPCASKLTSCGTHMGVGLTITTAGIGLAWSALCTQPHTHFVASIGRLQLAQAFKMVGICLLSKLGSQA